MNVLRTMVVFMTTGLLAVASCVTFACNGFNVRIAQNAIGSISSVGVDVGVKSGTEVYDHSYKKTLSFFYNGMAGGFYTKGDFCFNDILNPLSSGNETGNATATVEMNFMDGKGKIIFTVSGNLFTQRKIIGPHGPVYVQTGLFSDLRSNADKYKVNYDHNSYNQTPTAVISK